MLIPAPLQRRTAWKWFRCLTADYVLVVTNWLLLGVLIPPVQRLAGANRVELGTRMWPTLLGIGLLHAALITLMAYTEELQTETSERLAQSKILAKSVVWATAILCLGYSLQDAPQIPQRIFCCRSAQLYVASLVAPVDSIAPSTTRRQYQKRSDYWRRKCWQASGFLLGSPSRRWANCVWIS